MNTDSYLDEFLAHHGVKGQQWGVRNGPPYPIENKVMRKGTRVNSVSVNKSKLGKTKSDRWLYTYNPNDSWDSKVYKGAYATFLQRYRGSKVYEHSYEVVKDLKMPTKKERLDEYVKLYEQNKEQVAKDLENVQNYINRSGLSKNDNYKGAGNVDLKNLKTQKDFEDSYVLLNIAMENISAFKTTKKYADIMATKFDAMVDDNNQGIYNETHDPVIFFRANEALKEVGWVRKVPYSEIKKNYSDVKDELSKKGKKILL